MEIAGEVDDARGDGVAVAVLKGGENHLAAHVHDLRARPDEPRDAALRAHVDNPLVANRDGFGPASNGVHRVDATATEHEVRFFRGCLVARAGKIHGPRADCRLLQSRGHGRAARTMSHPC